MMKNDPIQGIVFDAKQTIVFNQPSKTKISRLIFDIKSRLNKTNPLPSKSQAKAVPSTDLLTVKSVSAATNPGQAVSSKTRRVILP